MQENRFKLKPHVYGKKKVEIIHKSCSLGGWGISMVGGFDILGRIPGVELGPGVESPLGVGVLDFRPGVPALSRCPEVREGLQ